MAPMDRLAGAVAAKGSCLGLFLGIVDGAELVINCGDGVRVGLGMDATEIWTEVSGPRAACSSLDLTLVEEREAAVGR